MTEDQEHNSDNRNKPEKDALKGIDRLFAHLSNSTTTEPRPGFQEALKARIIEARERKNMKRFSLASLFEGKRAVIFSAATTTVVVVIIAVLVLQPFSQTIPTVYAQDNFTLVAEEEDSLGVESDTGFLLESETPVSVSDIEPILSTDSGQEFELEQVTDNQIRIVFEEPLEEGEIVRFNLATEVETGPGQTADRPYGWAFQVKESLQVVTTLPGDKRTNVAMDSGVEITFSHENILLEDFQAAFSISPAVEGTFEKSRRQFVFVPNSLEEQTEYHIVIDGSLKVEGSDMTLGENYQFSFETSAGSNRQTSFDVQEVYVSTTPTNDTFIQYSLYDYYNKELSEQPISVSLYKFETFEQYVEALDKSQTSTWRRYVSLENLVDLSELELVSEFEAEKIEGPYSQTYMRFPMKLETGYYAALYEVGDKTDWSFIQSSHLTAYVAQAINETLVWVNDGTTGSAVEGAETYYAGNSDNIASTDSSGIAHLDDSKENSGALVISSEDDAIAITPHNNYYASREDYIRTSAEKAEYWNYIYTDRDAYKVGDTIQFWGFLKMRDSGLVPQTATVTIGYSGENSIEFAKTDVRLTENGTFTGELSPAGLKQGYYYVYVSVEGEEVASTVINVTEYVKPAYTLEIIPDSDAFYTGQVIGYTVHGEFFEGTPTSGLVVQTTEPDGEKEVMTLDTAGNARGSFSVEYDPSDYYPTTRYISVSPDRPEEGDIHGQAYVSIFGANVDLTAVSDTDNNVGTVTATVKNIKPARSYYPENYTTTPRANQKITGTITEVTYEKEETGQYYDFVRKQVEKRYRYHRIENSLGEFEMTTGQDGTASHSFEMDNPEANYQVTLKATDEYGKTDKTEIWLWNRGNVDASKIMTFREESNSDGSKDDGYDVGDTVVMQVTEDGETAYQTQAGDKFLYIQAQRGIREVEISADSTYDFTFGEEDVPNTGIFGVYFNGGAYKIVQSGMWMLRYPGSGYPIEANPGEKELTIDVSTDKENYRPGDEVTLDISVKDKDGEAVEADVNVNIVDEAFYKIFEENVDTLESLYAWITDGIVMTQVTQEIRDFAMAEGGGGGDGGARVSFKDTAHFETFTTDKKGNASLTFTLPDNITSWRVTTQAISQEDIMAGHSVTNVNATLPFFVNPVMRDSYLDGDEPTILIRSAGTELGTGDTVEYEVSVDNGDAEKIVVVASETARYDLPDMAESTHEITIKGSSGDLTDTIIRKVDIVPSRLIKPVISSVILNESTDLQGSDTAQTMVSLMDGARGKYYDDLMYLSWRWGDRADEATVRQVATEMMNSYFGENTAVPELSQSLYHGDNGIRLLPYAEEDVELTAKIALLQETPFSEPAMAFYLRNALNDTENVLTRRETAWAYAGLAALDEPVLAEVQRILEEEEDLSLDETIPFALALYYSGDAEGARKIYREIAKDLTYELGYAYLEVQNEETTGEYTAWLAILAGGLQEKDREDLFEYVIEQCHGNTLLILEALVYIREVMPTLSSEKAIVEYTHLGKRQILTLEPGDVKRIPLPPGGLAEFNPEVKSGTVMAVSYYDQPLTGPETVVHEGLSLSREYMSVNTATGEFDEGDLVKIYIRYEIDSDLPHDYYQLTDVLPSGLAPLTSWRVIYDESRQSGDKYCVSYPYHIENQRVSFFVRDEKESHMCERNTVIYYARVVTPGTYEAEPAYIRSSNDPTAVNYSNATSITITE